MPQVSPRKVKPADLVIVPASGLDLDKELARHAMLLPWLRNKAAQGAHIAGICTAGSSILPKPACSTVGRRPRIGRSPINSASAIPRPTGIRKRS